MKIYAIRINTIDNLYADYIIEAENLFFAKIKARKAFFRDYPNADENIKLSFKEPHFKDIQEIFTIIKEECK